MAINPPPPFLANDSCSGGFSFPFASPGLRSAPLSLHCFRVRASSGRERPVGRSAFRSDSSRPRRVQGAAGGDPAAAKDGAQEATLGRSLSPPPPLPFATGFSFSPPGRDSPPRRDWDHMLGPFIPFQAILRGRELRTRNSRGTLTFISSSLIAISPLPPPPSQLKA